MTDFRSWILEESIEVGSFTPNIGTDIISSKEKVDIDMGSKLQIGGSTSIPTILENLDYTTVDCDNLNQNARLEDDGKNPYGLPAAKEPTIGEENQTNYNHFGDRLAVDRRADEETDGVHVVVRAEEGNISNRTSFSSDHDTYV